MNQNRKGFPWNLFGEGRIFGSRGQRSFDPADLGGLGEFPGVGFEIEDLLADDDTQKSLIGLPWQVAMARFNEMFKGTVISFLRHEAIIDLHQGMLDDTYTIQFAVAPSRSDKLWGLYLFAGDETTITENAMQILSGRIIAVSRLAALLSTLPFIDEHVIAVAGQLFNRERDADETTANLLGTTADSLVLYTDMIPEGLIAAFLKRQPSSQTDCIDVQAAVNAGTIAFSEQLALRGVLSPDSYTAALAPFTDVLEAYRAHREWPARDLRYEGLRHMLVAMATHTADPGVGLTAAWTLLWAQNHLPDEFGYLLKLGDQVPGLKRVGEQISASLSQSMDLRIEAQMVAIWFETFAAKPEGDGFIVNVLVEQVVQDALRIVERKLVDLMQ